MNRKWKGWDGQLILGYNAAEPFKFYNNGNLAIDGSVQLLAGTEGPLDVGATITELVAEVAQMRQRIADLEAR